MQPNKEYDLFFSWCALICPVFPRKKTLQLWPNSLASSPLKVHSQLQPPPQLTNSLRGINKAPRFGSVWEVSWCPWDSPLEGSSQNTPPGDAILVQSREFQVKKPGMFVLRSCSELMCQELGQTWAR